MANTAKGYPYPVGTDRVMDGDDAIRNLATAVDTKAGLVASGTGVVVITAGNTPATAVITFPAGLFTQSPMVSLTLSGANAVTTQAMTLVTRDAASMTVSGVRGSAGNMSFYWIAVQNN
jgi:hypothetical protein